LSLSSTRRGRCLSSPLDATRSPSGTIEIMRVIEARYEDGLLKPETPWALTPGERVALIVVRHPDPRRWDLERLAKSGAGEDRVRAEQGLAEWADALDQEDHS